MRFSRRLLPVLLLLSAVPASAHDCEVDCTPMSPEARAEFENARMMAKLDCAGLHAYVEQQRWLMNQRFLAEYNRPLGRPRTVPGAYPSAPPPRRR